MSPAALRARAEALAQPLPPLLAEARQLAASIQLGEHGRRRPGMGDAFWQYRPAIQGDPARSIDWRRSARSDQHFVQEKEWQAAQSVVFWVDRSAAMQFAAEDRVTKADRSAVLGLALASLLVRGGERVGLSDMPNPPQAGDLQVERMARLMMAEEEVEYGSPRLTQLPRHGRAVFLSDFLGPMDAVEAALARATDRGLSGALLQVLDPVEEAFPFAGRTLFQSMSGGTRHETREAADLRDAYQERLAARKAALTALATSHGWRFHTHHTGDAPAAALLWLYHAMERQR